MKPVLQRLAVLALALGGAASAAAAGDTAGRADTKSLRECIDPAFTSSWTPYDDHTILVRSGRRTFQVTTNRCPRLADPLPRITTSQTGGGTICSPKDVRLYVSDSADRIPTPCFIQSITVLSDAEAKAMEARRRNRK